jgi:signal transduction histidine kinase
MGKSDTSERVPEGLMKPGTAFRWVGVINSRQRKGIRAASGRAKEGLGLIAMEERVRFVGGTFPLESAGRGVAIMIQVPSRGESV